MTLRALLPAVGLAVGSLAAVMPISKGSTPPPKKIEFNRDIRPILAEKCLACHGHDPKALRAGLDLNQRETAVSKLHDGHIAIVPNHPETSELVDRINAEPEDRMPPVSTNKTLTEEERNLLTEWIREGAEYKPHWGFVAPSRPPVPEVHAKNWARNSIDNYILAKLEEKGLHPSKEASKETLLRRLSLDIIGLPPTPAEVDAFIADRSPKAYEKAVDRLLASPRYGERMAMDWLDYARYADSNGYQADYERYQWRWRDWVIDAFNKNMPYDKFTVDQIAGDLEPHATLDQRIATGFNRNHRINTEGGVIPEEWRVETVIDRTETTSTVWLGLTAGCARCHDHKYDPISQKEFYQLGAYFNNVPETGSGEERPVNHPPFIQAPLPDQLKKQQELQSRLTALSAKTQNMLAANVNKTAGWVPAGSSMPESLEKSLGLRYEFDRDGSKVVAGKGPKPVDKDKVSYEFGRSTGAVNVSAGYVDLGDVMDFDEHKPFSVAVWLSPNDPNGTPVGRMDSAHDYRGWDLYLTDGKPTVHLISKSPTDAIRFVAKKAIPLKQWSHVVVTYDGSLKGAGINVYINGDPIPGDAEVDVLKGSIHTTVSAKIGRRTDSEGYSGLLDDLQVYDRVIAPSEVAPLAKSSPAAMLVKIDPKKRTASQKDLIVYYWSREKDPAFMTVDDAKRAVKKDLDHLNEKIPTVMVMDEMKKPRKAYVLIRGQYDKHGDVITPAVPSALPPLPKGAPNNRLGLAEWIVSPQNPLTARVEVNRLWERFFGTGIVATTSDFGTRSEFPSHPELLDWLAVDFRENGWDLKRTIKQIVMSSTYRQSSQVTPDLLAADPSNRYLARGPRFRLPAEVIRDQALFSAGLLKESIGGPSVRPYQPDGVWDETNVYGNLRNYKHNIGDALYRRSLYTIWKRTAAPPDMTLFDAPSREICRVQRSRTDTPLQALVLMNDVTFLEASRVLAEKAMLLGGKSTEARLSYIFRKVLSRNPSSEEVKLLKAGYERKLAHFRSAKEDAQKLVIQGDAPRKFFLDSAELATYTLLASTVMNLDETITKE